MLQTLEDRTPTLEPSRVLYINEALTGFGPGPAVHGSAVVRELQALGAIVTVFPPLQPGGEGGARPPGALPRVRTFLRVHLPQEPLNLISGVLRTFMRCWQVWSRRRELMADVIVARHVAYDWTPWLAARILRRPLVVDVNAPIYMERQLSHTRPPKFLRWMEATQWRKATRIRVVSRELGKIVQECGIDPERIAAIPNGADGKMFVERNSRSRDRAVRVLFVGGFYSWHGITLLIEAFAIARQRVPQLELLLIGHGPEFSAVAQQVRNLGLERVVQMPGRLPRSAIAQYLAGSDIAVAPYPSLDRFYFSPLKLFEYMAAALPVVASSQGQIVDLIEHGRTGILVPPGDIAALADGIVGLAASPSLRRQIGASARAVIAEHYTWAHTVQRLHSLCADAVRAHGGSSGLE